MVSWETGLQRDSQILGNVFSDNNEKVTRICFSWEVSGFSVLDFSKYQKDHVYMFPVFEAEQEESELSEVRAKVSSSVRAKFKIH